MTPVKIIITCGLIISVVGVFCYFYICTQNSQAAPKELMDFGCTSTRVSSETCERTFEVRRRMQIKHGARREWSHGGLTPDEINKIKES